MKRLFVSLLSICSLVLFTSCASRNAAEAQSESPPGAAAAPAGQDMMPGSEAVTEVTEDWPLTFNNSGISYSIFEPQCDSWNGHDFVGRSAVSVQVPGQAQPLYGTIGLKAITLVDKNAQTVKLADMQVTGASFPTAHSQTQNYLAALRGLPQRAPAMSLDLVQGSLSLAPPTQTQRLNNTPPRIIIDTRPAVLVSIDGPAVWKSVPGTPLDRAINTRVLLLRDASGTYYLHLFDGYLQANSLEHGHWIVAPKIPDGAGLAQEEALSAGNVDLLRGNPDANTGLEPSLSTSVVPDVFVATIPAELITFSGTPEYVPIPGTDKH